MENSCGNMPRQQSEPDTVVVHLAEDFAQLLRGGTTAILNSYQSHVEAYFEEQYIIV